MPIGSLGIHFWMMACIRQMQLNFGNFSFNPMALSKKAVLFAKGFSKGPKPYVLKGVYPNASLNGPIAKWGQLSRIFSKIKSLFNIWLSPFLEYDILLFNALVYDQPVFLDLAPQWSSILKWPIMFRNLSAIRNTDFILDGKRSSKDRSKKSSDQNENVLYIDQLSSYYAFYFRIKRTLLQNSRYIKFLAIATIGRFKFLKWQEDVLEVTF